MTNDTTKFDNFRTWKSFNFPCHIAYNSDLQRWMGYVGVLKKHAFFDAECEEIMERVSIIYENFELIFSDFLPGQPACVWWLGFEINPEDSEAEKKVNLLAKYLEMFEHFNWALN